MTLQLPPLYTLLVNSILGRCVALWNILIHNEAFHTFSIQQVRVKTGNARFHALFQFDLHSFDLKTFSVSKIFYSQPQEKSWLDVGIFCYFSFTDWFTVLDYDVIFTTLSSEYKAKQNHYRELGVLLKFQSKNFLKYKNILPLTILRVRNDFMATLS